MSSIIFHIEENQVFVATDTLATSHEGKPVYFTSKALILPHLKMIIAGTGRAGFLDWWFVGINGSPIRDIDALDRETTNNLATMWSKYDHQVAAPHKITTTTVYHFGFSDTTNVIRAYAYRSENGFQSELLRYGTAVKPECAVPQNYRFPNDITAMMDEQRTIQSEKTDGQRIYIGGEIQIHHLTRDGFNIYRLAEFEDYSQQKQIVFGKA